jgi:hypothetical protein
MTWNALPESDEAKPASPFSFVTVNGIYEGNAVRLQLFSVPPEEAGPGFRTYPDGRCNPV